MTEIEQRPSVRLKQMIDSFQVSQAIHVAATLGIADLLKDGKRGAAELASATATNEGALYRLLRALASVGVFEEDSDARFALTELGECLRSDAAEPQGEWARLIGRPYFWQAWGHLSHSIETGENSFSDLHEGMRVWEWRASQPEESAIFDAAMMGISRTVAQRVLAAYDFGQYGTVADIGGGNGAFLAAVLAKNPKTRGINFDQPHVVERAGATFEAAGVADRSESVGGSFFDGVPSGADAYVLKAVLHDWDDDACVRILQSVRAACGAAKVLVIEWVVGEPNTGPRPKISDLNMLVMLGGRERTSVEWHALFEAAGFRVTAIVSSEAGPSVIEGAAVR